MILSRRSRSSWFDWRVMLDGNKMLSRMMLLARRDVGLSMRYILSSVGAPRHEALEENVDVSLPSDDFTKDVDELSKRTRSGC